mgnify:CR=1 FL=1
MWQNLSSVIYKIAELGQDLIPLLAVIAFLLFILGVARFIRASANDKDFDEKKKFLIWSVIGMFVLVTIWGIISFLKGEFGFGSIGIPQLPTTSR